MDEKAIEAAARAIYESIGFGDEPWDAIVWHKREQHLKEARAAIEAYRDAEIASLESRVRELEAELANEKAHCLDSIESELAYKDINEKLEAENARLREALDAVVSDFVCHSLDSTSHSLELARAALKN